MNVYLHAQGRVRPEIKKCLNSLNNKALEAVSKNPEQRADLPLKGPENFQKPRLVHTKEQAHAIRSTQ